MLNGLRYGCLNREDARILASLSRPIPHDDGIEATELYVLELYMIVTSLHARQVSFKERSRVR